MNDVIGILRGIIRHELALQRQPTLASVTRVHAREDDSANDNHQVDVTLRGSELELQRVSVAVPRLGLSALPQVGDLALVSFVDGNLNAPVVVGFVYDDEARPPQAKPHEVVYQSPDEADSDVRRFHLELPSGMTLTFKDEEIRIAAGDTIVTIAKDGDVEISAKGKMTLSSEGDLELAAGGDLKLNAQGDLTFKGVNATLEGQAKTQVKGAQLALVGISEFSPS